MEITSLSQAVRFAQDEFGENGYGIYYMFVIDEDGYLVLLKRNDQVSRHQEDLNEHGEKRQNWPENSYDGEVLFRIETGTNRGTSITAQFLQILGIVHLD